MKLYVWCMRVAFVVILIVSLRTLASAQQPGASAGSASARQGGWWNPEFMMDVYVKALSRQYNLTPDQEEYTRKLLTKRVKEFLSVHETDLRTLMWQMIEFQQKKQLPPADMAQQWSKIGTPIFIDARKAILDGNKEWREILDDKQRQIHDRDLRQLDSQFQIIEKRLNRWKDGDVQPSDFTPANQPRRVNETWERAKPEDTWESYLRWFIIRYNLDPAQKETGESILRECRKRAAAFREKHKAEFDEIDARTKEVKESMSKGEGDKDKIAAAVKELASLRDKRQELEKPMADEIGKEFRDRLEQIPTKEQREAYERRRAGFITTRPASAPATAPAAGPS